MQHLAIPSRQIKWTVMATLHMCQYGMTAVQNGTEGYVMKPTRIAGFVVGQASKDRRVNTVSSKVW